MVTMGVQLDDEGQVAAAGGILVQTLPPHQSAIVDVLAERAQEMPPISELLAEGQSPEDVLALLFANLNIKLLGQQPLFFQCTRSRERSLQALATLGREEIDDILAEEGEIVMDCHFCHEHYRFEREEVESVRSK